MDQQASNRDEARAVDQTVTAPPAISSKTQKWLGTILTILLAIVGGTAYAVHLNVTTSTHSVSNQNSVSATGQSTGGACSPNIVGTGNSVNCPVPPLQAASPSTVSRAMVKQSSKPASSQPPTITQNCPSGICNGGDNYGNQTVNNGPIARVISDDALPKMTATLANTYDVLRVVMASSADDVFPLSQRICKAAYDANWGTACSTSRDSSIAPGVVAQGLNCYAADWTQSGPAAFKQAMVLANLSCRYIPQDFQSGGPGAVTLVIGSPQSPVADLVYPAHHGALFDHVSGYGGRTALLNCSDNVTFMNSEFVGSENGIINDPEGRGPCRRSGRSDRDLWNDCLANVRRDAGSASLIAADFDALRESLKRSIAVATEKQRQLRSQYVDEAEATFVSVGNNRAAVLDLLSRTQLNDIPKD
jgi:hypothetical protein